jgi:hypothetical protein
VAVFDGEEAIGFAAGCLRKSFKEELEGNGC